MKRLLAVLLLASLFPATVYAWVFDHGVQVTVNCAGYTITANPLQPPNWEVTTYDVSPGPGSYSWGSSTSVAVSVWVVWTNAVTGETHTFGPEGPGTIYGYKPGGCTPEEESGSPPSGSYSPPCPRHVHVSVEAGTLLMWDGHLPFLAGPDGALIEWAPPGQHRIEWDGNTMTVDISADFCGTIEIELPAPEPITPAGTPSETSIPWWLGRDYQRLLRVHPEIEAP